LDAQFDIRMEDRGRSYVLRRFSGGEQDVACLVLRLALARLACGPDPPHFIVLDEVFGSQDRLHRRSVLQALSKLTPLFPQVFLITHVEEVQDLLPKVLYISTDGNCNAVVCAPTRET
jgi:exonuclease SbcC